MPKTIFTRKPYDLEQVKSDTKEMKRLFHSTGDEYYVAEDKELSNQEWESLTSRILEDRPWIQEFSNQGYANDGRKVPCIRVTNPSSKIALIIDPQGTAYGRYVGIEGGDGFEIEDKHSDITEQVVEEALWGMLLGEWDTENCALEGCRVQTFENAGVMTYNKGLVVSLPDGSEFQITIVQSR